MTHHFAAQSLPKGEIIRQIACQRNGMAVGYGRKYVLPIVHQAGRIGVYGIEPLLTNEWIRVRIWAPKVYQRFFDVLRASL